MTRKHKTVDSLQKQLKHDLLASLENKIADICQKVVEKQIWDRVYNGGNYIGDGEDPYQHTMLLLNSVTVGDIKIGYKYMTFDIFMDSEKIDSFVRKGVHDSNEWNAHASVDSEDVSEYIPLWIEEGTEGSLHDKEGAHYMENSAMELGNGKLAQLFANALRQEGWNVVRV